MSDRVALRRRSLLLGTGALAVTRHAWAAAPLRLAYFEEFAPISFRGPDGRMTGILVDALDDLLGAGLGMALTHEGYPWPRAQEMVRTGGADGFCTNATAARTAYATFGSMPVLRTAVAIFYSRDSPRRAEIEAIGGLADLPRFTQGDYRGNGFAETAFKGLPIDWAPRLQNVMEKLAAGRNDLYVGNDLAGLYAMRQAGLQGQLLTKPTVAFGEPSSFRLGIRSGFADSAALVAGLDAALGQPDVQQRLEQVRARFV